MRAHVYSWSTGADKDDSSDCQMFMSDEELESLTRRYGNRESPFNEGDHASYHDLSFDGSGSIYAKTESSVGVLGAEAAVLLGHNTASTEARTPRSPLDISPVSSMLKDIGGWVSREPLPYNGLEPSVQDPSESPDLEIQNCTTKGKRIERGSSKIGGPVLPFHQVNRGPKGNGLQLSAEHAGREVAKRSTRSAREVVGNMPPSDGGQSMLPPLNYSRANRTPSHQGSVPNIHP